MTNPTVSIVIVCMNNLKNLYPCLDSIKKYTSVEYETLVVAYLFSKENLEKVRRDFPWAKFIESNEIRGFSENNNLALRQAKGNYCFVVNDDTEMKMPVIDRLVEDFGKVKDNVAIISPKLIYPNGEIQYCGRGKYSYFLHIASFFHVKKYFDEKKYFDQVGLFKSWNIIGAAFLIKTDLFRNMGWFDERFFFCPEDIALSEGLNKKGYECWADADVSLIHYEGMSGKGTSMMQTATKPAGDIGSIIFLAGGNKFKEIFIRFEFLFESLFRIIFHRCHFLFSKSVFHKVMAISYAHSFYSILSFKTPKEVFIRYYNELNN